MTTSSQCDKKGSKPKSGPMTSDEAAKINLKLIADFNDFYFRNPDVLKGVPKRAKLVFLNGSERLNRFNRRLGRMVSADEKVPVYAAKKISAKNWKIEPLAG